MYRCTPIACCIVMLAPLLALGSLHAEEPTSLELTTQPLPKWVTTLPYEDGVLHGLGQAPLSLGPAATHYARSLAWGAIASQINVAIEQESELSTATLTMIASGIDDEGALKNNDYNLSTHEFLQKMSAKTAVPFLPGATVVKQVTMDEVVYVLVRMPKANFEQAARAKVKAIDRLLSDSTTVEPTDREGIRLMRRAYQASIERQSLVLMATAMNVTLPPPPVEGAAIAAHSGLLIEPLSFRLSGADRYPELAEVVRDAADALGITIAEKGAPARFEFKLKGREWVREQAGWQRAAVSATIVVTHLPSRLSLGHIKHQEDQASTISAKDALARAYARLKDPIYDEIVERLFKLIARSDAK